MLPLLCVTLIDPIALFTVVPSVSGSNPHIHNPGGDPVPGMPYNFIQSGLKKNSKLLIIA